MNTAEESFSQCINLSFHLASGDRTGCLVAGYDRYIQEYVRVPQDSRSKHLGQCNGLPLYMLQIFLPDESVMGSGTGKEVVPKKSYLPQLPQKQCPQSPNQPPSSNSSGSWTLTSLASSWPVEKLNTKPANDPQNLRNSSLQLQKPKEKLVSVSR